MNNEKTWKKRPLCFPLFLWALRAWPVAPEFGTVGAEGEGENQIDASECLKLT
jgi:hypothetical protein